jgi:hypothetical protein
MTSPSANPPTPFAIVDATTGAIIRSGIAPKNDVPNQPVGAGQKIVTIPAMADASVQQIDLGTGNITARTVPDLTPLREARRTTLRDSCTQTIERGFTSSGKAYPSTSVDQINLVQASIAGGNLWCATAGTWALTAHTAAQAATVLLDFVTMRDAARAKLVTLESALDAATTATQITAVVWKQASVSVGAGT